MFVVERFISGLVQSHVTHPVLASDGGAWYPHQACKFPNLRYQLHSSLEKSLIERTIHYIEDRAECFDDFFLL